QLDPRGFFMSVTSFIVAGAIYLLGKRRESRQSVQIAPSQLDERHGDGMREGRELRARPKLILMLVVATAGLALPFFLIPRLPHSGRHEYLLEGQTRLFV